jgi:hypothetical protein
MPRFSDTQDAFRHGLAGAGVPAGLAARGPGEIDRRFAVYRNNVTVSLVNALRLRFPVIERLVGEEFAREMFRAFAVAHPPDSPLMMRYGGNMPAFLAEFPPVRDLLVFPSPTAAVPVRRALLRSICRGAAT